MTASERDITPAAISLPPTLQVTVPMPVVQTYERERIDGDGGSTVD